MYHYRIEDLTNTNTKLNRELGTLKMSVQDKETTLSQLERERNSQKETIELLRQQIQSYGGDFDAERQSREQIAIENSKLNQLVKDMELQFQRIREDYTTERTTRDLVASENKRLKQELKDCKTEHAVEKTGLLQQIEELQQKVIYFVCMYVSMISPTTYIYSAPCNKHLKTKIRSFIKFYFSPAIYRMARNIGGNYIWQKYAVS